MMKKGKKRKKVAVIVAVIAFAVATAAAVLYMYLSKWHWEESRFMTSQYDPEIYGDDNSLEEMTFFHVRDRLDLKLIYDMNISQGKYYVTIYSVPPGHINEKLNSPKPGGSDELYLAGYRPCITDDMIKVYENTYDKSGEYIIDTVDFDTGMYVLVRHADPESVIDLTLSIKYKQYNWMIWLRRIVSLYSDEFNYTQNRYSPY